MKNRLKTAAHHVGAPAVMGLSLLMATSLLQGCVAGPIIAEAAGPAIEKSVELARWGKSESFQAVTMDEMKEAIKKGADELDLAFVKEETCDDKVRYTYKDQKKQEIKIELEPRTPKTTYILVDVGWFGTEGMGQLAMRQILRFCRSGYNPGFMKNKNSAF